MGSLQMRGTAIIATRQRGLTEIVQDGKIDFLIPPDNPQVLAEKLLEVLTNQTLVEQLGASGRQRAIKHFTETRFVDQFIHLYKTVLDVDLT